MQSRFCLTSLVGYVTVLFFFLLHGDPRDLHALTHAFPTRRSSDLSNQLVDILTLTAMITIAVSTYFMKYDDELYRIFAKPLQIFERKNAKQERSEEHTSELKSLMRISYAVFCLNKKNHRTVADKQISITTSLNTTDTSHQHV